MTVRVGIVGGGASGTLVAAAIAREATGPVDVTIFESTGQFGRGVPYRTPNPDHRLNVPAVRMSALADDPGHFLAWLRERDPEADESTFAPRGVYGEYLESLLAEARVADPLVPIGLRTATVTELRISDRGVEVHVEGEDPVEVDRVVLAVGPVANDSPVPVPGSLRERGVFVGNAWDEAAVIPALADRNVLVIGTGLTMVDVALTLGGEGGPAIRAVSRGGLVPEVHRPGLTRISNPEIPGDETLSIRDLLGSFTSELARATVTGGDWRDAIDSMRSVTPSAWRRIPTRDKFWFLNHLNRIWEIHRYRMAPEVGDRFRRLVDEGQVTVEAARVESIEDTGSGARVGLLTGDSVEEWVFDRVISAMGATVDIRREAPEPIASLFRQGELFPDDLGLGLDVTPDGRAVRSDGDPSPAISVIGSLRRGVEWESIGVPELRTQAIAIARRVAATKRDAPKAPLT